MKRKFINELEKTYKEFTKSEENGDFNASILEDKIVDILSVINYIDKDLIDAEKYEVYLDFIYEIDSSEIEDIISEFGF